MFSLKISTVSKAEILTHGSSWKQIIDLNRTFSNGPPLEQLHSRKRNAATEIEMQYTSGITVI